ncbi:MAG: hypothetical protein IMZ65_03250 [Planctomycetes bacterium]|nr:hypothetical protein [Planctomycetota bacterium]
MSHLSKLVALSAAAVMVATPSIIPALQAAREGPDPQQVERPQVAPPGRETMYRRAWQFSSMVTGGVVRPRWMADGNSFSYAEGAPDNTIVRLQVRSDHQGEDPGV